MHVSDLPLFAPVRVPYQKRSYTSRAAADRVRPHARNHEADVYDVIVAAGAVGRTRKELAAEIGWSENQQNRITGRVASLLGKEPAPIVETDRRRDGSKVLVASCYQEVAR
jgi:hypothetical protein